MKRFWFNTTSLIVLLAVLFAGFMNASNRTVALAQEPTPGSSDVYITVTYEEQINIRNGPGTGLYDIIGNMQPGDTAQALGVSPGRDWVQIVYPAGPGGVAWVHSSLVSLSAGNLNIVEPPPTITPRVTATIDPTLVAAYNFKPTATRLPKFTPPPPLAIPQFTDKPTPDSIEIGGFPLGVVLLALGIPGLLGYLISVNRRR